jgi:hypothetical protein
MDRHSMILILARAARKVARAVGRTPVEVLEILLIDKFQNEPTDGKALTSTPEAGGAAGFAILSGMHAAENIMNILPPFFV